MTARVRIGTSGFAYRDWIGLFYPEGAAPDELLALYAERLAAVEVSASFHRLPRLGAVERWSQRIGSDFRLCLTASRHLTRDLRVSRHHRAVLSLRRVVEALGEHAGPVLVQVPPAIHPELAALEHLLDALEGLRVAIELREPEWHSDAVLRLLSARGAALVVTDDVLGMPRVELTADFTYWRLRRVSSEAEWESWAERAAMFARRGVEVYGFLKQDREGQAALRAMALARRVDELLGREHRLRAEPDAHASRLH